VIEPDWRILPAVRAFVTTRELGDVKSAHALRLLRGSLPADPVWLQQVHGKRVVAAGEGGKADAVLARKAGSVCAVMVADCMPVLLADEAGTVVAAAHAGWRGLAAGVLEATVDAMAVPRHKLHAWLGPAIGPRAYEVGEDVRLAFSSYPQAFVPTRPHHWRLDLYAVAREKLKGLKSVSGGGFCTYSEPERFFSYRRDRASERMGAFVWLA